MAGRRRAVAPFNPGTLRHPFVRDRTETAAARVICVACHYVITGGACFRLSRVTVKRHTEKLVDCLQPRRARGDLMIQCTRRLRGFISALVTAGISWLVSLLGSFCRLSLLRRLREKVRIDVWVESVGMLDGRSLFWDHLLLTQAFFMKSKRYSFSDFKQQIFAYHLKVFKIIIPNYNA